MARRSIQFKITLGALIFAGLIFLLYYLGLSSLSSSPLTASLNPVIRLGYTASSRLGDFFSLYFRQKDLAEKNEALKQELINLAQKNVWLNMAKDENEILKKELQFVSEYKYNYLLGRVIGYNADYENNYLLIDKGSRTGLTEGLAVTINQGMIIGRLAKVEDNFSYVELLTDNNSKIAVLVLGEEATPGLAVGENNLNLNLELLPKSAKIEAGNLVATSNLNDNIPSGLILGRVKKIEFSASDLWQTVIVEPLISYNNITIVTIILPGE